MGGGCGCGGGGGCGSGGMKTSGDKKPVQAKPETTTPKPQAPANAGVKKT